MVKRCVDAPTEQTDLGRGRKRVSAFRCVVVRSESEAASSSTHLQASPAFDDHRAQSFPLFHIANLWTSSPSPHPTYTLSSILPRSKLLAQSHHNSSLSRTYTQLGLLVTAQESHRANLPLLCSRDRSNATGYSASATQRYLVNASTITWRIMPWIVAVSCPICAVL